METQAPTGSQADQSSGHRQDQVSITINGNTYTIHRGHQKVSEIKRIGDVPQADVLEQLIEGNLVLLDDDGAVVIRGDEQFVSHPRDSASS